MFKMIRMLVIVLTLATLQISPGYADGYVGPGTITYLQNAYNTQWILIPSGANSNPDSFPTNIVMLDHANLQYKEGYALLLIAYLTQMTLNIYVSGCTSTGYKLLAFVGASN